MLPVLSLPDGAIRADEDTAVAYPDVEEAISTARWLVGGGGWIGAVVFRKVRHPKSGLYEDAETIMRTRIVQLPHDARQPICHLLISGGCNWASKRHEKAPGDYDVGGFF